MIKNIIVTTIFFILFNINANANPKLFNLAKFGSIYKISNEAIENFPQLSFLKSDTEEGVIKFELANYYGDIKNGKAHGNGVINFINGSKYEGKFKRNMFHGKGMFTDKNGEVFKGKWKYNKLIRSINTNTREIVYLSTDAFDLHYFEIRGDGALKDKWFNAKKSKVNIVEIPLVTKLDIFDLPSAFSDDYGDEKKIQEILAKKNADIVAQNKKLNEDKSNIKTVYVLTEEGKKDLIKQKKLL